MNNIKHLLDVVDKVRDHVALGLMSDPGLSKTSQIKQWAEEHDRKYFELIISQRMPSEISGMPMPVTDTKLMEIFDFNTLLQMEDGDILSFDEFTNGNIQTLNACLTLIQERTMLSGKKLPSIIVVAMGNPQGRCDLLPQTKQRFWWVDVQWHAQTWKDYMFAEWGMRIDKVIIDYISNQFRDGFKNDTFNYWTPRTMENLIRVANEIEADDVFWEVGKIDNQLKEGIYRTIASIGQLARIKQECYKWIDAFSSNPKLTPLQASELDDLKHSVKKCIHNNGLKAIITNIEEGRLPLVGPAFIEFLNVDDEGEINE